MSKKDRYIRRAESHLLSGRMEKAIASYLQAHAGDPSDLYPLVLAGDLYNKQAINEKAVAVLRRAADGYLARGQVTEAIAIYRKVNKISPSNPDVLLRLAELYWKTNALSHALRFIAEAAQLLLNHTEASLAHESHCGRLLRLVERAVKDYPWDPELMAIQARLYESLAREDEAFALYWQATHALAKAGKLERSLAILDHLRKKRPFDTTIVATATSIMTKLGRPHEALDLQRQTLVYHPEDTTLLRARIQTLTALAYYEEAEEDCCKLYGLDQTFYTEFLELVRLFVSQRDHDRALRCIRQMIPHASYVQEPALRSLLKNILEHDPHHIDTLRTLAEIYEHHNDMTSLLKIYPTLFYLLYKAGADKEAYQIGQRMLGLSFKAAGFLKTFDALVLRMNGKAEAPSPAAGVRTQQPLAADGHYTENEETIPPAALSPWGTKDVPLQGDDDLSITVELLARYGHYDRAIQILESHLETMPQNTVLHEKLGSLYLRTHRLRPAAQQCQTLHKLHLEKRPHEKAEAATREALTVEPTLTVAAPKNDKDLIKRFAGDLSLFTLAEVIQFIEHSCKTGALEITFSSGEGTLLFNSGQVVDAHVGRTTGVEAFYHLMSLEAGRYEFKPRTVKFPKRIALNTTRLLLEGLLRRDKRAARLSGVPPQSRHGN